MALTSLMHDGYRLAGLIPLTKTINWSSLNALLTSL